MGTRKNKPRGGRGGTGSRGWVFLVLILTLFVAARLWRGSTAPVPRAFEAQVGLADALERAASSGRPVFAVVTADWCAPCQSYKRGALSDAAVERALRERTEAVYIDADRDGDDMAMLARMGVAVRGVPATVVIRDRQVVARFEGPRDAGAVLEVIDRAGAP